MINTYWTGGDSREAGWEQLELELENAMVHDDFFSTSPRSNQVSFADSSADIDDDLFAAAIAITSPGEIPSSFWTEDPYFPGFCETVHDEPDRTPKASDEVTANSNALPLPKIMKNDLRRYYPSMFMNTINSAEFRNIQSYFHTYMAGPCGFVATHQVNKEIGIPDRLATAGPRLMSHYLLGCFVQYPDMVLSMKDSRIVTNVGCAGSKIVMDMEVCATKIYDLEVQDWVPQVTALGEMYQQALVEKVAARQAGKRRRRVAGVVDNASPNAAPLHAICPSAPAQFVTAVASAETMRGPNVTKSRSPNTKRGREVTATSRSTGRKLALHEADFEIPEAYMHALFSRARLLPRPVELVMTGTITMFLDATHHMQHMCLDMRQINT
jgi:hypothetical protein